MLDLKKLIPGYSFWTGNGTPVTITQLSDQLSTLGYSFTVSKNYIKNPSYDCIMSADGMPLVLLGFHRSDNMPGMVKNGFGDVKKDIVSQFHYDLLFTPQASLLPSIASLNVLASLFRLIDGIALDLKAQRILTENNIKAMLGKQKFGAEDFVSIHYIDSADGRGWVHTHGMEKFGLNNLETYSLKKENVLDCIQLFNDLTSQFMSGNPAIPNTPINLKNGVITIMYSYDVRPYLTRENEILIKEHMEDFFSVIDFDTVGDISSAIDGYFLEKRLGSNVIRTVPGPDTIPLETLLKLPAMGFTVYSRGTTNGEDDHVFTELVIGKDGMVHWEVLIDSIFSPALEKGNQIATDSFEIDFIIVYKDGKMINPTDIQVK
ncbi:hypothetical protein KKF34_16455 [Myxococcota bacterium]|nr:hypothetical protein [Myxococcota bacterium]MBU1381960.1 hypothetical protein [Myxococcota bacterium]MBU1498470.1 hypothetical protein [Myxococcota bacterium]